MVGRRYDATGARRSFIVQIHETIEVALPEPTIGIQLAAGLIAIGAVRRRVTHLS
jgi:hypothetical protein